MRFHFNDGRGSIKLQIGTPPIMALHIIAAHMLALTSTGITRKICDKRKQLLRRIICAILGIFYWGYSITTTYCAIANR
jgi:hypothetical protein